MEPRQRVIQKSIELFTRYGIRQVTMDQVAEEVGMSKRTIYEMFRDKDTLIKESLEAMNELYLGEVNEILANASNVIEALYKFGQHGHRVKSEINPLFFEDIRRIYPHLWEAQKKRSKPSGGSLSCGILERGIKEGIFMHDLNLEIVDAFFSVMMDTFHKKDIFPENATPHDLVRNIINPYFVGISTEKGRKLIEQYGNLFE
ncbi:MAG TPA: TetR/AcrR family transcriptional regulator [Bacteroidales bacterium]|nr:TetR/AcrR family transcriptional regulator [Bacteroidales bacterium]HNS46889.1 TetR/AcrR family transcriptional regulator [Bacteroidales bacterium]